MDATNSFNFSGYLVALGVGLLVGSERERSKGDGPTRGAAGVRSFVIAALLGAVAGDIGIHLLSAMGALAVIVLAVASYRATQDTDPGITTELALCLNYFVGILAASRPQLAGALGVLLALILVSRSWLHDFVLRKLSAQENLDAILLAAAALIVLPMLPDRAIDPYGIVNPRLIWRLTLIVMVLNAFGYIALRTFGAAHGLLLAGLLGGFISSSATIATMGHRARQHAQAARLPVAAAALSSIATVIQLALILAASHFPLLVHMMPALVGMGAFAAGFGALFTHHALSQSDVHDAPAGRAFQPRQALWFAAMITAVLWVAAWLADEFGSRGALVGIAAGGFADAHSASATAAALALHGDMTLATATLGVLIAITANTVTKAVVAFVSGGVVFGRRLLPGLLSMLAGLYLGAWLTYQP